MIELRRRYSDIKEGGGNTDIEYETAIEVTGGSITTDWIPQAGAIVKWDCMVFVSPTGVIADQRYFDTIPDKDDEGRVFDSNNTVDGRSVYVWIDYKYGYGAKSPWSAPDMKLSTRHTYIWDGLNGRAGYDGNMTTLGNKRTTSSGYPLRLFCGRTSSRIIIYGIELINQESEGGQTYTLRPARKEGVVGLYCEETGVFWSSDNGVEFTIYQE